MQRIIGIDFGTSTTYMNVKRYNGSEPAEDRFSYMPVVFNYGESSGFVASIVRENADGTFDFGGKAEEQLEGARIYKEIKMLLESPDDGKREEARRITQEFFRFLFETYEQQTANLGSADDTVETILSYPVKWQPETVEFMMDAASKAGFRNVRGMDEATAAVSAVLCQNANSRLIYAGKPGYLMLADMGAGTTDLVVCRYCANDTGEIQVELVTSWPRTAGEPTFGGREIDRVLEKYVEDYLAKSLIPTLAPQAHVIAATPGQAKMWKEQNVSVSLAAGKPVTTCAYIGTYKTMGILTGDFPAFGRTEFQRIAEDGLRDYVRLLQGCLDDAAEKDPGFASAGLDLVILTGGHSAWYFAQEIIDGAMEGYCAHPALEAVRSQKQRVVRLPNPQTTVSLGLVYSRLPFGLSKPPVPEAEEDGGETLTVPAEEQTDLSGAQPGQEYIWYYQLLSDIRRFFAVTPAFSRCNVAGNVSTALTAKRVYNLADAEILYVESAERTFSEPGNQGRAITGAGIHMKREQEVRTVSWPEFLNARLEYDSDPAAGAKRLTVTGDDELFFTGEQADGIAELQALLRQRSASLREQLGQVKAPEGGKYLWSEALLPELESFITRRDDISEHFVTETLTELRRRLMIPAQATIFLAHDDSVLKSGGCGFAVTDNGIYYKDSLAEPLRVSWEEFINGQICVLSLKYHSMLGVRTGLWGKETRKGIAVMALVTDREVRFRTERLFRELQEFLRDRSMTEAPMDEGSGK